MKLGKIYKSLPELLKKELAKKFIEKIEIFPEEREDGSVIKSVTFRFPINIGGELFEKIDYNGQTSDKHVETVVLLSNRNSSEKNHIKVNVDMDEYRKIKETKIF